MTAAFCASRRWILQTGLSFAAEIAASPAFADTRYPDKPVHLIVPYPAGGSADFLARALQPRIEEILGQPAIIENRGGASGMIGSAAVAKARPDGYTLLLGGSQTHIMNVAVIKNMLYDPVRDFTPIIATTRANWIVAANPSTGIRTPGNLVAAARAKPDQITYASSGNGSVAHLGFSLLASELGLRLTHVPYKGIAQGITDVLAGQVNLVMGDQSTLVQHVKSGALIAVAMTGNARSTVLPDVPTLSETIFPGFDVPAWQGIWGPPGMDASTVATVNAAFAKALGHPTTLDILKVAGVDAAGGSPEQFSNFIRTELDRWTVAARKANITPE